MKQKRHLIWIILICVFPAFAQQSLKLENEKVLAEFNPANGSLIRLINKETNWNIVNRAQLGQSFEMLVPLQERRLHYVRGVEQTAPAVEKTANSIIFTWKSLKSKHVEKPLDITFKGTVTLTKEGLVYSGEVINNAEYAIEYMAWPFLGEVAVPDKQKNFIWETRNDVKGLFPRFGSDHGYWGVEYPTNFAVLPENSFLLIRNDNQGIYIGTEQATPMEMLITSFELIPGFDLPGQNPQGDEMDGQLVRMQFKANHVIYTQPKSKTQLQPVKMELYKGSWHKGIESYKKWKQTLPTEATPVDWVKQPLTWQKISISNGNELINYAREAQKLGVSVLSVNGWMRMGSQSYLEIADNLSAALQECKKLNVKVVLEANFTSADFRSKWYNEVLKKEVITDPFGWPYDRRILCPLDEDFLKIIAREYRNNTEILSADGMIIDDNNHRGKSYFCFDPNHGHAVPEFVGKGIFELDKTVANLVSRYADKFVMMGYGLYDTQSTYYNANFVNNSGRDQSIQRFISPDMPMIATMDVRTARIDMNKCLKNRHNICYDLRFYNNQLNVYPQITAYGKQIEELRKQYKDFIWDGTFQDVLGASVSGNNVSYSVYSRKSDGKKAIVILNTNEREGTTAQVSIQNSNRSLEMASPENPQAVACNGTVTLQPQSVVVVIEK